MTHFPASTTPEDVSGYQPQPGDSWDHPGFPGSRYYRRSDGYWTLDERKDEDPRHDFQRYPSYWHGGWRDCDRCKTSVYDRVTLGMDEVTCNGERRNVRDRWIP